MPKKSFKEILMEQTSSFVSGDDPLNVNTPEELPQRSIKNPSFDFQVNGNFNFKLLEKFLTENEMGLEAEKFILRIETKGNVSDEDYENFIRWIESKITFLKFEK